MKKSIKAWALINSKGKIKNWNGDPMSGCAVVRSKKDMTYPDTDGQIKPTDKVIKVIISYTVSKPKK